MTNIYIVKWSDLEMNGTICAFTSPHEARRYAQLLTDEIEDEDSTINFYTSTCLIYNECEEISE